VRGITIYHIGMAAETGSDCMYYRTTLDFALTSGWDEFPNACAQ